MSVMYLDQLNTYEDVKRDVTVVTILACRLLKTCVDLRNRKLQIITHEHT